MGPSAARAPLLLGLLAAATDSASAQRLPYDIDGAAVLVLPYDIDGAVVRLSYDLDALAREPAPFDPSADEGALTILGVAINAREREDTTLMAVRGGVALVPVDDLRRWRFRSSGAGAVDIDGQQFAPLASVAGLRFRVDQQRQILVIDVPVGSFENTALSAATTAPQMSPAATTAFLNYDLSLQRAGGSVSAGAFLEMGASSGIGLLTNTMVVNSGGNNKTAVRLDTYAIHDDPSGLTRLTLGDTLTRGSSWSPQTRFAGVRYGTDFSLQPGFLSFPTPLFDGQAALPSNVEVYVNNVLRYQTQVDQGPFALDQLPLLSGAGKVALRVNDALGVQRTVLTDYYVSTRLLRAGLFDYSLEAGAERRRYGFSSFDYGRPFVAGTHRYGLTNWLTSEARGVAAEDLQMLGGGLATTLGQIGEAGFAVAGSNGPDGTGMLYRVFASRVSPAWSVSASYQHASRDFAELGQIDRDDRLTSILQLAGGVSLGAWGNVNASQSYIRRLNDAKTRVSALNYSRRVGRSGNLTGFIINSEATGAPNVTTIGLAFSLSFRSNISMYAQADSDGRRLEVQKSLPTDRGWGYRAFLDQGERDQQGVDLSYRGSAFEVNGEAVHSNGDVGLRVLANGGFLFAAGGVVPTRRLDSGFAIVDVGGQRDVRVLQDNREVARTNGRGIAIVSQLRPYEANRIGVASDDLHLDTTIRNDTLVVVPRFLGGVVAKFGVGEGHAGTVVIQLLDGKPLEPGTPVTVDGTDGGTFAGFGGEVFVESLAAGVTLTAARNDGPCKVTVTALPDGETLPRIGPLICAAETK